MGDLRDNRPWYEDTVKRPPGPEPLRGEHRCDVCVVGGGFTGVLSALELAERGQETILLEAGSVGDGASGRNGGQVVSGYNLSSGEMRHLVGRAVAQELCTLAEEGKQIVWQRIREHGIECDDRSGFLYVGLTEGHVRELEQLRREMVCDYGLRETLLLDERQVRSYVDSPRCTGGVYDPTAGHVNPLAYLLGLTRAARDAGVRLHERSPVVRVRLEDHPIVWTRNAIVRSRALVLAGNAYLEGVVPDLHRYLLPLSTFMLATEPLGSKLAHSLIPSRAAACDMKYVLNYFRVTEDGRLLFGGGIRPVGRERRADFDRLDRRMRWMFPQLAHCRVSSSWSGRVGMTRIRMPRLGRLGEHAFFAHGYSGHGLALTTIAARVIAEAIEGSPARLESFSRLPHRRLLGGRRLRTSWARLASAWYATRDKLGF